MEQRGKTLFWHRLDNTANLFPVVSDQRTPSVYRMTAELFEEVEPALLKEAVRVTLPWFPAFRVQLKRGFFWAYLEDNPAQPKIFAEEGQPCRYIEPRKNRRFLFRILYFQNRIHLEAFHALTDGKGALMFLKAVCYQYLMRRYPQRFTPEQRSTVYGAEGAADVRDSYMSNYERMERRTFKEKKGFQFRGEKWPFGESAIVNYLIPADALKETCRSLEATVSQYLTAHLIWAAYTGVLCRHAPRQPFQVFLPVDLRKMFESDSALNFFSNILISLPLQEQPVTFIGILEEVKRQFAQKMDKKEFQARLAYTAGSQKNMLIRCTPLCIKNLILKTVYRMNSKGTSIPFSNLGLQQTEPLFADYFKSFRAMLGNCRIEPVTATACTYRNCTVLTLSSVLQDTTLMRELARNLAADGLAVEIETNHVLLEGEG